METERGILIFSPGSSVAVNKPPEFAADVPRHHIPRIREEHDDINVLVLGLARDRRKASGRAGEGFPGAKFTNEERHVAAAWKSENAGSKVFCGRIRSGKQNDLRSR